MGKETLIRRLNEDLAGEPGAAVRDESTHSEEKERILRDWPL